MSQIVGHASTKLCQTTDITPGKRPVTKSLHWGVRLRCLYPWLLTRLKPHRLHVGRSQLLFD